SFPHAKQLCEVSEASWYVKSCPATRALDSSCSAHCRAERPGRAPCVWFYTGDLFVRHRRGRMADFLHSKLVVTGASGHLGRRVVELLVEKSATRLVAATRTPEKLAGLSGVELRKADFSDPASLDAAFAGADRVLVISTDRIDVPGLRIQQHKAAVEAAKRAGVKRILYTSM